MNEPFACSLTDERLRVRLEEWLALDKRALLRAENRPSGRLNVYRAGDEIERVLAELIEAGGRVLPVPRHRRRARGERGPALGELRGGGAVQPRRTDHPEHAWGDWVTIGP